MASSGISENRKFVGASGLPRHHIVLVLVRPVARTSNAISGYCVALTPHIAELMRATRYRFALVMDWLDSEESNDIVGVRLFDDFLRRVFGTARPKLKNVVANSAKERFMNNRRWSQ